MMSWVFLILAVVLDVIANIAVRYSDGFSRKAVGILSLVCVIAAFACLAQALQGMELSVAYAFWGVLGLSLTALADFLLFGQRLTPVGWLGLACMIGGVSILHQTTLV